MSQNKSTTISITGAATIGPHLSPNHASRMIVARQSAKTLHASFSPMITISDSSGRRISRSSACCTERLICSRVCSIRASENSAVSDAASGRAQHDQDQHYQRQDRHHHFSLAARSQLIPSCDNRRAITIDAQSPAANDSADATHRHAQAPRQRCFAAAGPHAEKQFVVFATAQRVNEIVAHQRAIGRRDRNSRRVDFRADAASFQNVPEVLHEPVADVDRGRRWAQRRKPLPRIEPRGPDSEIAGPEIFSTQDLLTSACPLGCASRAPHRRACRSRRSRRRDALCLGASRRARSRRGSQS